MFHLHALRRLVSATRRLRQPAARPSCRRPSFELLPDRILPSIDVVSPVHADYAPDLAEPDSEQMRFMEVPSSGSLLQYWESGAFSLSAKQMFDLLGGPAREEQLGTPVVTRGTVEFGGEAFATLNVEFSSSVSACFAFAGERAGSAGSPGSAPYAKSFLVGGLLELDANGGERRFLMDYRGSERFWPGAPALFGLLRAEAEDTGGNKAPPPAPGGRPAVGGPEPTEALLLSGTTGPPPPFFMAGRLGGSQIAEGLSTPSADDPDVSATAEVAVHAPGNPADVLLTVDTVLPDARADLVRLQNADLAMVPTYVVDTAPATPFAPPRMDERPDLGLAAQVVGLELPGDGSLTHASTDRWFDQVAWADSIRGVAAGRLELGELQPAAIDVADAVQASAQEQQSAVRTDAAIAPVFREWLASLLHQGEKGAVMVPLLALEGLLAFVYWRGLRTDRHGERPK
jgi:hypothetical protein